MANYTVGYRKPPKRTQFKKGQSGNPHGRLKTKVNFATLIEQTLNETVVIVEDGKKRRFTRRHVAIKQLVEKAAKGDMRAFRILSAFLHGYEDPATQPTSAELEEADRKVLESLSRRFEAANSREG